MDCGDPYRRLRICQSKYAIFVRKNPHGFSLRDKGNTV
jgi:hypothetical protein